VPFAALTCRGDDEQGLLMPANVVLMDCPAYLDSRGGARCGLPAEVEYRYTVGSTDGPLESARIRCPRGHWFNGPIESLTHNDHCGAVVPGAAGASRLAARSRP